MENDSNFISFLKVQNFKSIQEIDIPCRRVNVFVGEPNTGKSNILEVLGLLSSFSSENCSIRDFVRYEAKYNLFYENQVSSKIVISYDNIKHEISYSDKSLILSNNELKNKRLITDNRGINLDNSFRFYIYNSASQNFWSLNSKQYLSPPSGNNLGEILITNKELRILVRDLFEPFGLTFTIDPHNENIQLQKEAEGIAINYPYSNASDTLRRLIFHLAAIETNTNSIIAFEEPEAYAFPFYTKFLSERIAKDISNQYFLTTHNPYVLIPLLEKTPIDDINVHLTYWDKLSKSTKVISINQNSYSDLIDWGEGAFFNLDLFIPGR